ncbi:MAG: surface protein [Panacagrimonas sp.]|jgi:mannosyltransferase OCH1-like enzyme|nr:hypothetical protein [Panacagrimonas sp.]MCC2658302.1 surface protein [Panacagrimonas sp.]
MKATLHLGLHKTGTSYVQAIYRQLALVSNAAYIGPKDPSFKTLKGQLLRSRNGMRVQRSRVRESAALFREAIGEKSRLFLSDETLIGATPWSDHIAGVRTLYPTLERQGELISHVFGNFDAEVVITVREPVSFLYSIYRDGLRYAKYTFTFDEFLDRVEIRSFRPEVLIQRLRSALTLPIRVVTIEGALTPEKLRSAGLISDGDFDASHTQDPKKVNTSSPLSVATIQRLFGSYDPTTKAELRKWLAACPVQLQDHRITFSDVAKSPSAEARISREISAQMVIPRSIHFAWLGEGTDPADVVIPEEVGAQIEVWRRTVPDFDVKCWLWNECVQLIEDEKLRNRVRDAVTSCRLGAMRADIVRLAIVLAKGGVWCDVKNRPRQNFVETAMAGESLVLCEHPPVPSRPDQTGHICNGFFAAVPGHAFIREVLELALRSVEMRKQGSVYSLTGGGLFNQVAAPTSGERLGRILPYQEVWEIWMCRVSMGYNKGELHWSKRQKVEALYFNH